MYTIVYKRQTVKCLYNIDDLSLEINWGMGVKAEEKSTCSAMWPTNYINVGYYFHQQLQTTDVGIETDMTIPEEEEEEPEVVTVSKEVQCSTLMEQSEELQRKYQQG